MPPATGWSPDVARILASLEADIEGVRARIMDKDNHPAWRIARIEDVSRKDIARMFASPGAAEEHPLRHLRD